MKIHYRKDHQIKITLKGQCSDISKIDDSGKAGASSEGWMPGIFETVFENEEFEVIDSFYVKPDTDDFVRAGSGHGSTADFAMIDVALKKDEQALILTEEDGFFQWHTPIDPTCTTKKEADTTGSSFLIQFESASPTDGKGKALFVRKLISGIKVVVIKYVLGKVTKAAVKVAVDKVIEKKSNETGPVLLDEPNAEKWKPIKKLPSIAFPSNRAPRVLLMIHGTFSSTQGSFGDLVNQQNDGGRYFFEKASRYYDIILGYDHKTLSETPAENAAQILSMLQDIKWPEPPVIDAVAYSRGGLVYRTIIEQLLEKSAFEANFNKIIFVGCTNSGTLLASYENWEFLINLYTNIILGGTKAVTLLTGGSSAAASSAISILSRFLKYLAQGVIEEKMVPGLAAMSPDSDTIKSLNKPAPLPKQAENLHYGFVTCNFEPNKNPGKLSRRFLQWLADRAVDRLMHNVSNDLVVNTSSMTAIDKIDYSTREPNWIFDENSGVYHTVYFEQPKTALFIGNQLEIMDEKSLAETYASYTDDVKESMIKNLDALPDRVDLRDWEYRPNLKPLPKSL